MTKQQLLQLAKRIVDGRRFAAEEAADKTMYRLRHIDKWRNLEHELRSAEVDLAMGNGDEHTQGKIAALQEEMSALLKALGVQPTDLVPQYSCKLCNDTGYIDGKMCRCLRAELRRLIIDGGNVICKEFTFENSTEKDRHNAAVYRQVEQIVRNGVQNVLLTGKVGTGKTYLLTASAQLAAQLEKSVLFVTAYSLNADLLAAHLEGVEAISTLLNSLVDVDLLLIDDLGTEKIYNNVTGNYLFTLLNERSVAHKQTFFSTNLTLQQLNERYDERVVSRLIDKNTTFVAQLTGKDKRTAAR